LKLDGDDGDGDDARFVSHHVEPNRGGCRRDFVLVWLEDV
jgi:hypothetical protein